MPGNVWLIASRSCRKFDGKIGRNYHRPMVGSPKSVLIHTDGRGCFAISQRKRRYGRRMETRPIGKDGVG